MSILQEAIKKGIADADPDARSFARKAYWGFADHFKDQADVLLSSLDGVHRRALQAGEMSNSSSSNSLNMSSNSRVVNTGLSIRPRSRQSSVTSSQENLLDRKTSTLTRKNSGIPLFTSPPKTADGNFHEFFLAFFAPSLFSLYFFVFHFEIFAGFYKMTRSKTGLDLTPTMRLFPLYENENLPNLLTGF